MTRELFDGRQPHAVFSEDKRYRWFLKWPTGNSNESALLFIGANPSKAGSLDDNVKIRSDPTVSRMTSLARELGFGWLWVANCRSYVSTDPDGVPPDPEGIGDKTDATILSLAVAADLVICAFGHLAGERGGAVMTLVRSVGKVPHALALTANGTPRHPRGVPKSARPFPMESP